MNEPKRSINIRIRDLRRERALTQEELAEALGLSRQSINAMEAGRCLPSLPVALQIASYFSVPLSTVFALEEQLIEFTRQVLQEEHEELGEATLSLIPWSPMHTMREMLQPSGTAATHEPLFPAVNVWQSESDIWAEFRLPGYRTEDLSIEIGEDFLTVEGEESSLYSTTTHFIRREFQSRPFTRTISLPMAVYSEHSEAEMRSGILRIRLPKVVAPKPKTSRISIKSAD